MERVDPAALEELMAFLPCPTPEAWIVEALKQQEILLLNHCYLEQCAARTALGLIFRCPDKTDVLVKMSKLAREELHHFEQVLALLIRRGYRYKVLKPSRYAGRSCERFAALAPHVDEELCAFFESLLKSEARHYKDYLTLAQKYADESIDERVAFFGEIEREAIESPDDLFRFHSGIPHVAT